MKLVSTVLAVLLAGMPLSTGADARTAEKPRPAQYRFIGKSIPYETLTLDQAPAEVKSWAEPLIEKATAKSKDLGGFTYILISAGKKPTGGWQVSVMDIRKSFGSTKVLAEIVPPGPDDLVTMAESYPFQIVRVRRLNHRVSFSVLDRSTPGQGKDPAPGRIAYEPMALENAPSAIVSWVESRGSNAVRETRTEGQHTYILVSDGVKPTGGYSVVITDIIQVNNQIIVKAQVTSPTPGQFVTEALTHPFALVRIAKTNLPISFQVTP